VNALAAFDRRGLARPPIGRYAAVSAMHTDPPTDPIVP
jgi:hypothetical protein